MGLWSWLTSPTQSFALQQETLRKQGTESLTAAAKTLELGKKKIVPSYSSWQEEVWGFYDELGEFRFVVDWKSEMGSRVRLRIGEIVEGEDEPVLVNTGPAVELLAKLGGIGKQSDILSDMITQLCVPGEAWLAGENQGGVEQWDVYSRDELRFQNGYQVVDRDAIVTEEQTKWRPLADDFLITKVWRPHKRRHSQADSPARAARSTMRELELVNRKIQAQYLSRLASAGVFAVADEITFPVREEFQEAEDPFVQEWIESAAEAIKTPGTAAAVVPIPMRVPMEFIEKGLRFIDFGLKEDDKVIEKRESAIRRLATQLDVPAEILLGMGDVNHWGQWHLEEQAVKAHIIPDIEVICNALTIGYLQPRLKALNEDPFKWVIWYDASEIILRPDRSEKAVLAYDRLELGSEALLRETGFDKSDAPDDEELKRMILKKAALDPSSAFAALEALTGDRVAPEPIVTEPVGVPTKEETAPVSGPPEEPVDPGEDRTRLRIIDQAQREHLLQFSLNKWSLWHPPECRHHLFSCPFTHEMARNMPVALPGQPGFYSLRLSRKGELEIGRVVVSRDPDGWIEGTWRPHANSRTQSF